MPDFSDDDDFSLSSDDDFEPEALGKNSSKKKSNAPLKRETSKPTKPPMDSPASHASLKRSNPSSGVATGSLKKTRIAPEAAVLPAAVATSVVSTKGPPVASAAEARSLIKSYMISQNRPYSCIQVYDNLHHRVTKTDVQKALDDLTSPSPRGCLRVKDYGKAKIYFVDQATLDTEKDKRVNYDVEIERLTSELKAKQATEKQLRSECDLLASQPEDGFLDKNLTLLEQDLADRRRHLDALGSLGTVDPAERESAIEEFNFYRTAWRERKEKVASIVDMLADGMEKSLRQTMALVGVETDEDEGVKLPPAWKKV